MISVEHIKNRCCEVLLKFCKKRGGRDFSLHSGERQTGIGFEEIRKDHLNRYEYAVKCLLDKRNVEEIAFGLDVFCGTGYGTKIITKSLGVPVLGIDASDEAIDMANKYYSDEYTIYASKKFPFSLPSSTFDFIICYESLEHVFKYDEFMMEMAKSLKPSGLLMISTPNSNKWSLDLNPHPFHFKHFTSLVSR